MRPGSRLERTRVPGVSVISRLRRLPLFYKMLIVNAVLIMLGAVIGVGIAIRLAGSPSHPIYVLVLYGLTGIAISLLVNAIILRVALRPLELQKQVAFRIRDGDWTARVPRSSVTDRDLDQLMQVFNEMLDVVSDYRARLRDAAARALRAEEEERKRISRELHDETAQVLTALLLRLRLAQRTGDPERLREALDQIRADLVDAVDGVRRLAAGLRPPALDELGLAAAIQKYAEDTCRSHDVALELDLSDLRERYPPDVELALYRIAQEALSNAARHSGARTISLSARWSSGELTLRIEDDGRGFDVAARSMEHGGLGITGMIERASYMGAIVTINSEPGRGTRVIAVVPAESVVGSPPGAG